MPATGNDVSNNLMMKQLFLVRHGKAARDVPVDSDQERPLLRKGVERTLAVAAYLKEQGVKPQLVLSSHALRAFETATLIGGMLLDTPPEVRIEKNIYYRGREALYDIVTGLKDDLSSVMMVGHNPYMTDFVNMFADTPVSYLPTSAVAAFAFQTDRWSDILLAERKTLFYVTPRQIKG